MRTGTAAVFFTGGETMLRKDLPQILRSAARLGYYPITLNSNATIAAERLCHPDWSDVLAHVDVLSISLDSLSVPVLQDMYGGAADKRDILRNLLALRGLAEEYQFKLGVNAVVQPDRIGHARDVMDWANAMGITFAGVPQNRTSGVVPGLLSDPSWMLFGHVLLDRHRAGFPYMGNYRYNRAMFLGHSLTARGRPVSCRNLLKPYVEPDGMCELPCNTAVDQPKVRLDVRDFATVDQLWTAAAEQIDIDGYGERCGGSCRWAQHIGASYYYTMLFHPVDALAEVYRYSH